MMTKTKKKIASILVAATMLCPILKVEKYILKRSRYSNADFFEIQGIAGGNFGIPSAVVEFC